VCSRLTERQCPSEPVVERSGLFRIREIRVIRGKIPLSSSSNSVILWDTVDPGTRLGPYEIHALIGAGGMGEVYRAGDSRLGRDVAIKVSAAQFSERFEREARAVAALNHPNICTLHDVGPNYLVMEYVEGESPKGPLPLEEALRIARQIADALEAAHEKGIVHRDLKPGNIKVKPDGTVKVLDFGLAKQTGFASEHEISNSPTLSMAATQAGVILGTAAYMAPEQARGKPADKRADIWAFGVVLYELLTGERLFQGEDVTETLASVVKEQPQLNNVPVQVRRLLKKCLEKDPKKRLRDIGDAWELLEGPVSPAAALQSSRLGVWGLASAGVLALALGALAFVHFRETPPPEQRLQYTIPLPEKLENVSNSWRLAISPNGRYLVIAATVSGRRQLWLREMDALEARPMASTDDATFPFWSPDSRWIGFFASGKLRKIAVGGGPSQELCDVTSGLGGTWNREDVIVFSSSPAENVLRRISAVAGGTTSEVTHNKLPSGLPVFLPDGRRFLYVVFPAASPEKAGIYLGSLDGKEDRRILTDVSNVAFAPSKSASDSGHILFVRENNLMAQPFDSKTAQIFGEVFSVAEGIPLLFNYRPFSVSENGILVYWTRGTIGAANQIVWYDRNGKVLEPISTPGDVWTPSLSPDGKTVAFARYSGAYSDLWLRDLVHQVDQRFTTDRSRNDSPVWSPNGDRIAFRSTRSGQQEIWLKATNGSGKEEMLQTDAFPKFPGQWSPDGRSIVYSDNDPRTRIDIWYIPLEGDRKPVEFPHTNFDDAQGQISPDGKWMAYMSDKTGQREVYVAPFPSGEGELRISSAGGEQPRWRRDGKELFYVAADGKMMLVTVKTAAGSKPAFDRDAPFPLFDARITSAPDTRAFQYDVSADGKRFLVVTSASSAPSTAAPALPPLNVVVNWSKK
jgi:eukaryotic-like serine/threonine-protein kinase